VLEAEATGAAEQAEAGVSLSGLRVLVVDDEPLAGVGARRALSDVDVVAVTSAAEALARVRAGEHYDRILCDVMMPEMSGPELYAELGRIAPELQRRVVFMTGGAFTDSARAFVEAWHGPMIFKPFERAALRRLLHDPVA
jgi:CheY-like chemotaxis protein